MFANQSLRISPAVCGFSLMLLFWAFVGTIDGPVVRLESTAAHLLYQPPKVLNAEHVELPTPPWSEVVHRDPAPLDPSFILFDLKQDLRRWPNVAGDISRSPPFHPVT